MAVAAALFRRARSLGQSPGYAPRHLATLFTSRTFRERFTLGAGARYVSEQFVSEDNRHAIESYVTVDAVAAYRVGRSRLSVNVRNLTNTEFETRGFGGGAAVPGRPFEGAGTDRDRGRALTRTSH